MSKQDKQKRNLRLKDARPGDIVDSAMTLWANQGFSSTRIEDIAKGAGVAKGTVYIYFESKEAIFASALEARLANTMNSILEMIESTTLDTRSLLEQFYHAIYHEYFIKGSVTLMKVLIAEGHRFPDLVKIYREIALSKGMAAIKKILHRGVERGELDINARTTDARLVMAPVVMIATWSMIFNTLPQDEFEKLIGEHLSIFLCGLQKENCSCS